MITNSVTFLKFAFKRSPKLPDPKTTRGHGGSPLNDKSLNARRLSQESLCQVLADGFPRSLEGPSRVWTSRTTESGTSNKDVTHSRAQDGTLTPTLLNTQLKANPTHQLCSRKRYIPSKYRPTCCLRS